VLESGAARGEIIVLDRWCYLGTVRSEAELGELAGQRLRPLFDLDTYKILMRFFARPRGDYRVVELAA
jgi:DNA polymerase-3 subunit epsilon